jgi:hypothetical protein
MQLLRLQGKGCFFLSLQVCLLIGLLHVGQWPRNEKEETYSSGSKSQTPTAIAIKTALDTCDTN